MESLATKTPPSLSCRLLQFMQPGPILTHFLLVVLFPPALLEGGEAAVLLGCGARLGSQLWEGAAARAGDVCSPHVLPSQRGAARIWCRVCRSGFHYTTELVAAAPVRSRPRWVLLVGWAPFPGNAAVSSDGRKKQDFSCNTNWVLMEGWSGIVSACEMWETYQKHFLQTTDWKNNNFL